MLMIYITGVDVAAGRIVLLKTQLDTFFMYWRRKWIFELPFIVFTEGLKNKVFPCNELCSEADRQAGREAGREFYIEVLTVRIQFYSP